MDFDKEEEQNEQIFIDLVKRVRPDIYVFMDLLDSTGVNSLVLLKVMRQIHNVATGNKYGKVTIEIDNGTVTFVRGEESDRVQEPAITKKDKKGNFR